MLLVSESAVTQWDNSSTGDDTERRRGLRIRQARPVKLYAPAAARYIAGQTCDVSRTGLRISLPAGAPIRMGDEIHLHVGLSDLGNPLVHRRQMMAARIVWIDRTRAPSQIAGGANHVEAGIEFLSTLAAHRDAA